MQQQVQKLTEEATVREESKFEKHRTTPPADLTNPLTDQVAKLQARLANAEELTDLYVENSFGIQTQIVETEEEVKRLEKAMQLTIQTHQKELLELPDH